MSTKNNSNDFECEFCHNKYSSKSVMLNHQKTAKKCLILRDNSPVKDIYKCDYCDFSSIRKDTCFLHTKTCKKMKKKLDEEKDIEINNLKIKQEKIIREKDIEMNNLKIKLYQKDILLDRLEKDLKECKQQLKDNFNMIASKPTVVNKTTHNTRINNLVVADFKESTIRDKVETNFTLEYLNDGIKGVAKFTKDHIVNSEDGKHKYICSDPSRGTFKYKDENGVVQKDIKATKLKNAIKDPIITKSKTLFIEENSRLFDGIANGDDDNENNEIMNEQITVLKDNFLKVKNLDDNQIDYTREMILIMSE